MKLDAGVGHFARQAAELTLGHLRALTGDVATNKIHLFGKAFLQSIKLFVFEFPAIASLLQIGAVIPAITVDAFGIHFPDIIYHAIQEIAPLLDSHHADIHLSVEHPLQQSIVRRYKAVAGTFDSQDTA